MAKRSPWAAQTRMEKKRVRGRFNRVVVTDKFERANTLMTKSHSEVPVSELAQFLRTHKSVALKVINSLGGHKVDPRIFPEFVAEFESRSDLHDALRAMAHSTAERISHEDVPHLRTAFSKNMRSYVESRKLPFDKNAFENTLSDIGPEYIKALVTPEHRFNPRLFERVYLQKLKHERKRELVLNASVNDVLRRSASGMRLTTNQMLAAKRWIRRTIQARTKKFRDEVLVHATSQAMASKAIEGFYAELALEARKEVLAAFVQKGKKQSTSEKTVLGIQSTKLGSRAQRLADYESTRREEKTTSSVSRTEEPATKSAPRAAFDSVSEALMTIAKENAPAAARFSQLIKENQLSPQSLVRLHDRGSLAQRTFLTAIDGHAFLKQFDVKEVNALARMIAFIGPMGKLPSKIKRASQSTQSEALFSFLEKSKLIETQHGGGLVVYLHRPQSKTKV